MAVDADKFAVDVQHVFSVRFRVLVPLYVVAGIAGLAGPRLAVLGGFTFPPLKRPWLLTLV